MNWVAVAFAAAAIAAAPAQSGGDWPDRPTNDDEQRVVRAERRFLKFFGERI